IPPGVRRWYCRKPRCRSEKWTRRMLRVAEANAERRAYSPGAKYTLLAHPRSRNIWLPLFDGLHALCDARLKTHHGIIAAGHAHDGMRDDRELRFGEPAARAVDEHRSGHSALLEHWAIAVHETGIGVGAHLSSHRHVRDRAVAR